MVKDRLTLSSILTLVEGSYECVIYYDTSHVGLGFAFTQQRKVIDYASRKIKVHEKNCPTHDLD